MNAKVLIAMRGPAWIPDESIYVPIHIGERDKELLIIERTDGSNRFVPQDVSGINIAEKYPHYGILTGLYYGWKNLECDALGLLENDRFFATQSKNFLRRHWDMKELFVMNEATLEGYLNEADIIVPMARSFFYKSLFAVVHRRNVVDLHLAKKIIEEIAPEYLPYVNKAYKKSKAYMDGLFIMKKPYLDSYCEFLFRVLNEMESRLPQGVTEYSMDNVSLALFNVWIEYVRENGALVKEVHCMHMDNALK